MGQDLQRVALNSRAIITSRDASRFLQVRQFLRTRYQQEHQALLRDFLPYHIYWQNDEHQIIGSVGVKRADAGEMFLEQYLDQSIELLARAQLGIDLSRDSLVEVGNLACVDGFSFYLLLALTKSFYLHGIEWVAFTATSLVDRSFRRLGMCPVKLVDATQAKVTGSQSNWGRYYERQPAVYLGRVADGVKVLLEHPKLSDLYQSLPDVPLQPTLTGSGTRRSIGLSCSDNTPAARADRLRDYA